MIVKHLLTSVIHSCCVYGILSKFTIIAGRRCKTSFYFFIQR